MIPSPAFLDHDETSETAILPPIKLMPHAWLNHFIKRIFCLLALGIVYILLCHMRVFVVF
jgi:hypothetical protein